MKTRDYGIFIILRVLLTYIYYLSLVMLYNSPNQKEKSNDNSIQGLHFNILLKFSYIIKIFNFFLSF